MSRDCIDAETLAMWADGRLPPMRATAVEAHVSDCALCQELVATFARTEPELTDALAQPAAAPWLSRWWLPLAGGLVAATLLITPFVVRRPTPAPTPESTLSETTTAPAVMPPSAPPPPPPAAPPAAGSRATKRSASKPATSPVVPVAPTRPAAISAPPPPASPPPPPQQVVVSAAPPVVDTKKTQARETFSRDILENIPSARDPWKIINMTRSRPGVVMITTPPIESARFNVGGSASGVKVGRAGRGGSSTNSTAETAALASRGIAPSAAWWVVSPSAVEWQLATTTVPTTLPVDMPSRLPIVGGSSPSERVCWLFANDAIWMTSDADRFARVSVPASVTITGLTAVDALHATVTGAGGRRFSTIDGGKTWLPER